MNRSQERVLAYWPVFDRYEDLADVTARAAWYFSELSVRVHFYVNGLTVTSENLAAPSYMDSEVLNCMAEFRDRIHIIDVSAESDRATLWETASDVLIWNTRKHNAETDCRSHEFAALEGKRVYEVDANKTRKEGSVYLDIVAEVAGGRAEIIEESKGRLDAAASKYRGAENAMLVATGPSSADYKKFDHSKSVGIVCNSIVLNNEMMDAIAPEFVVFGDPIFHFGPSRYAMSFRQALLDASRKHNFYIVTALKNYHILAKSVPELRDRIIAVPLRTKGDVTFDLLENFEVKALPPGNILTLFMIPLGTTVAKSLTLIGCDGRPLEENSYFWSHNKDAQINEYMKNIQRVHPAFFDMDYNDYYTTHCETLEWQISEAEKSGYAVSSGAFSYIPALARRQRTDNEPIVGGSVGSHADHIVIIDPDSIDSEEHFLTVTEWLSDRWRESGKTVSALVNNNILEKSLGNRDWMVKAFSGRGVDSAKKEANSELIRCFEEELGEKLKRWSASGSVHLAMYHGGIDHIGAIASVLEQYREWTGAINLYWAMWGDCQSDQWLERLDRQVRALGETGRRLKIFAPTRAISELWYERIGISVDVAPQPSMLFSDEEFCNRRQQWGASLYAKAPQTVGPRRPLRVLMPGSARAGKGFGEALELADKLRSEQLRFTLRNRHSGERRNARYQDRIRKASAGVEVVEGQLSRSDMARVFNEHDVVVLSYSADDFARRTSGLMLDAVYCGVPVVVPEACWLGDFAKRYGCGVAVKSFSPETVKAALDRISADHETYCKKAWWAALDYFWLNSWEELAESLSGRPERAGIAEYRANASVETANFDIIRPEADALVGQRRNATRRKRRLLIIGNGPSVKALVAYGFRNIPSDVDTFGMGAAYRFYEDIDWWPTYYALADRKVVYSHRKKLRELVENPRVATSEFFFSWPISNDRRLRLVPHKSTGDTCFRKAIEKGYTEIYLIGIEGSYVEEIAESRPLTEDEIETCGYGCLNLSEAERKLLTIVRTPEDNPNYFFNSYQREGDVYSLPQAHTHRRNWGKSLMESKEKGVTVINLSDRSSLENVPEASLEEVFGGAEFGEDGGERRSAVTASSGIQEGNREFWNQRYENALRIYTDLYNRGGIYTHLKVNIDLCKKMLG